MITFEVTDLFGGEANYSWVQRGTIPMKRDSSNLAIVRKIKGELGWTGHRCRVEDWGDTLAIYPNEMCQVCFVDLFSFKEKVRSFAEAKGEDDRGVMSVFMDANDLFQFLQSEAIDNG